MEGYDAELGDGVREVGYEDVHAEGTSGVSRFGRRELMGNRSGRGILRGDILMGGIASGGIGSGTRGD